ncbi:MAG TPA: hypothetical protein PKG69_04650, partial [Methanoregulaceae archaeon]|nr:hypothetical protein [Methanoregulaceae archaeon]
VKKMGKIPCITYTRAGTARRSGNGLSMDIAGSQYFIVPDDVPSLFFHKSVDVVDPAGEREGTAWLSPIHGPEKHELTTLIERHLYVIGYRDLGRIFAGDAIAVPVREYHPI